jgi:hypothetical protein
MAIPLLIVHGYSDKADSFRTWADKLSARGIPVESINLCNWVSLSNEITVRDIAEGFDRALRFNKIDGEFDALVHSTGILVVRTWMAENETRLGRLKHLIALAPATFGSPLAQQGRSVLGGLFKGSKNPLNPDFLNAGDLILDALELGSQYTWDLTQRDILGDKPSYGLDCSTPYVFVFTGTSGYDGLSSLVNTPGTDGTVRWAGCSLDTEQIRIDFRLGPEAVLGEERIVMSNTTVKGGMAIPFWPVSGVNHGTIVHSPPDFLVNAIGDALSIDTKEAFLAWQDSQNSAGSAFAQELQRLRQQGQEWQQLAVHAIDQFGQPVNDYHISVTGEADDGSVWSWEDAKMSLHIYRTDRSYRCYHVNLSEARQQLQAKGVKSLQIQVIADSGSERVGYRGEGCEVTATPTAGSGQDPKWNASVRLPLRYSDESADCPKLFYPFTTTFVEIILEREAYPFGADVTPICTLSPYDDWSKV